MRYYTELLCVFLNTVGVGQTESTTLYYTFTSKDIFHKYLVEACTIVQCSDRRNMVD
jgi:hypothetical protein